MIALMRRSERSVGRRIGARQDCFGCRWTIPKRGVGSLGVVVVSPPVDQYLGFTKGVEDLRVEQLVAKLAVNPDFPGEPFIYAFMPRLKTLSIEALKS